MGCVNATSHKAGGKSPEEQLEPARVEQRPRKSREEEVQEELLINNVVDQNYDKMLKEIVGTENDQGNK